MAKVNREDPLGYRGDRVPLRVKPCGFCADVYHENCATEIAYFDKLWICGCSCNDEHWRYYEGKERITDDMRTVRVPGKARQHAETSESRPDVQEHEGPGEGEISVEDESDNGNPEVKEIGDALPGEDSEAA